MAFQLLYQRRSMSIVLFLLLSLNYVSSISIPRQARDTKLPTPAQKFSFNSELGLAVPDPWKSPSGTYYFRALNYRAPYISLQRAYQIYAYLLNDAFDESLAESTTYETIWEDGTYHEIGDDYAFDVMPTKPPEDSELTFGAVAGILDAMGLFLEDWADVGWFPTFDIEFSEHYDPYPTPGRIDKGIFQVKAAAQQQE